MKMLYFDWMISGYYFLNSVCLILAMGDYTFLYTFGKIYLPLK